MPLSKKRKLTIRNQSFLANAAKAIDEHVRTARYGALKPERAFIHWFVEARYGAMNGTYVSDGKGDGGLDAVLKYGERWIVLQSKYELKPALSGVSQKPIDDLAGKADLLRFGTYGDLEGWLQTVSTAHRKRYRALAAAARKNPNAVEFILITNRLGSERGDGKVLVEGIEKVGELWRLFELGLSPPADQLAIEWQQTPLFSEEQGLRSWVGFVELSNFVAAMKNDPAERLFAENVRTYLHSAVNRQIAETYQFEPRRFWLGNNGIYVVCRHSRPDGLKHYLNFASIINGSQTLHSIEHAARHPRSCKVLVRVLEFDGQRDPDLLNAIIKRTNSQNSMKLVNLFAHDAPQVNIARYFQRYHVFYERREREWQNEKKGLLDGWLQVPTLSVLQWLTVANDRTAVGLARAQPARLFDEERYESLLRRRFTKNLETVSYRDLALVTWCGMVITRLPKQLQRRGKQGELRRVAKIASLFLVRALYLSLKRSTRLQRLVLEELLPNHRVGRRLPPPTLRQIKRLLSDVLRVQQKAEATNEKLDLSNFFKGRETTQSLERKVIGPSLLRSLATSLERGIATIA